MPVPDDDYEIEMVYRKTVPALTSSAATNWLLTFAPDLYLYGTLREAAIFMQEDERITLWAQGHASAMDAINRLGVAASFNASPVAVRVNGFTP